MSLPFVLSLKNSNLSRSASAVTLIHVFLAVIFLATLSLPNLARILAFIVLLTGSYLCNSFVGAMRAFFASIVITTGVVATAALVDYQNVIRDSFVVTIALFSFFAICGTQFYCSGKRAPIIIGYKNMNEAVLIAPMLLVAVLMRRWMAAAEPVEIFNLFGSEDNAAWISVARGFVNNELLADGLTHPAAKSPAVGPLTGVMSYLTGFGTNKFELEPHVKALETIRNCYAFLILSGALLAGAIAAHLGKRLDHNSTRSLFLVCPFAVLAEATLLNGLFSEYGFMSFIYAIVFALLIFEFSLDVKMEKGADSVFFTNVVTLLSVGLAAAWWGVTPVGAFLLIYMIVKFLYRNNFEWKHNYIFFAPSLICAFVVLRQLKELTIGNSNPSWILGVGGSTPSLNPFLIFVILLATLYVFDKRVLHDSETPNRLDLGEALLASIVVFSISVSAISIMNNGVENYASQKMMFMLLPVFVPLLFGVSSKVFTGYEIWQVLFRCLVVFYLVVYFSSNWINVRGPSLIDTSKNYRDQILNTISQDPGAVVVCLHSSEESRVQAYSCSRLALALSGSELLLRESWLNALLYPDRTPNGVVVPEDQTTGGKAALDIRRLLDDGQRKLNIVVFPDMEFDPSAFEWNDDFWWLNDLPWDQINIVR